MRMETHIPHLEPVPAQPNYPGDWHLVCLHKTFLDSESPLGSPLVGLNSIASYYLGFLVQTGLLCKLPRHPTFKEGEKPRQMKGLHILDSHSPRTTRY